MQHFKADLHIHTVLSPCGSLEMSPVNIIRSAIEAGLDMIAITDHNSTRQFPLIKQLGKENGLFVIGGVEVNTLEEVHCLALFETGEQLTEFQDYIDEYILKIKNRPKYFGYQVVVDRDENIVYEEPWLLINALNSGIFDIEQKVHSLDGLFIPAHIDRQYNGIISQLGFIPENLNCDALELSSRAKLSDWKNSQKLPSDSTFIRNSDAHQPCDIGKQYSVFEMEAASFSELKKTLQNKGVRKIIIG